jgi:spore germination cell wall hydrolase CwlJ-like protein
MAAKSFDRLIRFLYVIIALMLITIVFEVYEFYKTSEYRMETIEIQEQNVDEQKRAIFEYRLHEIEVDLEESYRILDELQKTPQLNPVRCLTDNIYYEAGFESYEGQLAVAQVTLNRAHERSKDICSTVYYKKVNPRTGKKEAAFSWTLGAKWRAKGMNRSKYQECMQLARAVLTKRVRSGIIDSSVKFYHAVYMTPSWKSEHEEVATIGNHIFYR